MSVYILHLSRPLKHARHYIGFADNVKKRFNHHVAGTGSRFTQVCHEQGITLILARVFRGATRTDERRMKNGSRIRIRGKCPVCCCLVIAQVMTIRKINSQKCT